ncbi:hypothetical protein BGAFAR04_E0004 (plasmid) [Borreliella garinii Far04]|nr:hypothetical protein BGAFAR04_E0004 [Borreliella garinii Far04]
MFQDIFWNHHYIPYSNITAETKPYIYNTIYGVFIKKQI